MGPLKEIKVGNPGPVWGILWGLVLEARIGVEGPPLGECQIAGPKGGWPPKIGHSSAYLIGVSA